MSQQTKRLYKGKDVDMITALSTIIINAKANQKELQKKRTNLTIEYLDDVEKRLNDIIKKYFGLDNAGQLRRQTNIVYSIQDTAYTALSEMKSQVQSSYSTDKTKQKEVLNELGYNAYFKAAGNNDTEAIISLLLSVPAKHDARITGRTNRYRHTTRINHRRSLLCRHTQISQRLAGIIQRHKKDGHRRSRTGIQ